jgi:hypothetical protein
MANTGKKQEISVSIEQLEDIAKQITEIDTQISAASGSEAQVRKSIAQGLASENSEVVDKIVDQALTQFEKLEAPVLAGLLDRLEDALKEKFKPTIDAFIDERVKAQSSDENAVNVTALREARKAKVEGFRALRTILATFLGDEAVEAVPEPKRAAGRPSGSGGGAKSGKNKEGYQYVMDGKDRPPSQNSFSSLAYYSTLGCAGTEEKPERWSSDQLKSFLAEQGVNFGTDETFEVKLPNGKTVGARKDANMLSGSGSDDSSEETATEATPEPANA